MKYFYTTFVFGILAIGLSAQGFLNPANRWNVLSELNFGGATTEIFRIGRDSIIGNKQYKIIDASFDSLHSWQYMGMLREEANRVYYIPQWENTPEGLLYDFNLQAGDTAYLINYYCWDQPWEYICQAVDSILYDGNYIKRWNFEYPYDQWLDGIGSINGLIYGGAQSCIFDVWFTLLCYSRNDSLLFMNEFSTSCYINTTGIEEIGKNAIKLSPNPLPQGHFLEIASDNAIKQVEIYTAQGTRIRSHPNINSKIINLATDGFAKGIYLVRIITSGNLIYNHKIIIE